MTSDATRHRALVVVIDGPAGSGKSSTARAVAAELGYRHLDSGAFYRALALALLRRGVPAERWEALADHDLASLGVEAAPHGGGYRLRIEGEDVSSAIRAPEVTATVSRLAAVPAVRRWLLDTLRAVGAEGRLVADGRDMGTVVFPNAGLKVFLVCALEERARRRLAEHGVSDPSDAEVEAEVQRLDERDRLDSTRAAAPLLRAADAVLLDTTELAFAPQVAVIARLARSRMRP